MTHTASVALDLDQTPPYTVRRIEFRGNHRFPDRFPRRRIGLREGAAFDEHTMEIGLARLARTSYFRPFKKEDIQVELNEAEHTADLAIHLQEIGRQRVAFSGGREQFSSTLGIAYTVFNLLSWDEHLSAQIDGAPEVSRWPLALRKKDFLAREARWLSPSSTRSFVRVLREACKALSSRHRRKESTSVGTIPFRMSMRSQSIMDFHAQ